MIGICSSVLRNVYCCSPFVDLVTAYNRTFCARVCLRESEDSQVLLKKGTAAYQKALNALPGASLRKEIIPLLQEYGIRKDLIVVEVKDKNLIWSCGTNFSEACGDAYIVVCPGLYETDKEACMCILKHEIAHIKNHDSCVGPLVRAISMVAAFIIGYGQISSCVDTPLFSSGVLGHVIAIAGATSIAVVAGAVAKFLRGRYEESRSDDFAIQNSSVEELKGGWRFFQAIQNTVGDISGDYYPSMISRIEKIKRALRLRGVEMQPSQDQEQYQKTEAFIRALELKN